ncbi:Ribosomal protein L15 [Nesidiocoris tenuis]|uniref:Large ribosomal subunit protein uL15m n=1 Tax=Nesidiocoris tenuis TaxID=355587 RepID=A0ABN7AJ40_9HEMI|nr:Ribosomal protein L15 [Nesidiocoris tenuis]
MGASRSGAEKALDMLRCLPRIALGNVKNSQAPVRRPRGRGQYGGDKHGCGNKGSGQRQNYMRPGYETGNNPFYLRFPYEPYYQGHHLKKQYLPLPLTQLQRMIETERIDASKPIDMATLYGSGLFPGEVDMRIYGFNLTDEGADSFKAKINIEVQWACEGTIAAIERCGGVITTSYYDLGSMWVMRDPEKFFKKSEPLPRRPMPSQDVILYYTDPKNRGYLADPEEIAYHRLALAQKYGYNLPEITKDDPMYETLMERKDPRQILYGLEPGWIVNLVEKEILKPKSKYLVDYYTG